MIGYTSDIRSATRGLSSDNNVSHKFTKSINGRFHVAGMSGSFLKSTKRKAHDEAINNKLQLIEETNMLPSSVAEHAKIDEEMQKDEERLIALQQKLEEVKHQRILKEQRLEDRKRKKKIFKAATLIQKNLFQAEFSRKYHATLILKAILK